MQFDEAILWVCRHSVACCVFVQLFT